jgi:hypothetical protein
MPPVKYELGFYIPEDGILHSHRRDNLKSCIGVYQCYGFPGVMIGNTFQVERFT